MLALEMNLPVQAALVVIPAAVYFMLLGLVNSRPNPQLVSGRTDFIVLNAAFFPLAAICVLNVLGASVWMLLAVAGALAAAVALTAPARTGNWVIYNVALPEALRAAERALRGMGEPFDRQGRRLVLRNRNLALRFSSVPLLRNVAISTDGDVLKQVCRDFEYAFGAQLAGIRAAPTTMAVTFLLLASALLVAPLGLLANRMPEMVRLLTDLVK
jgi:nitrate reductase NapE component